MSTLYNTQPVNTFTIVARECSRALAEERALRVGGLRARMVSLEERVAVEVRVLVLQALTYWHTMRQTLSWFLWGKGGTALAPG